MLPNNSTDSMDEFAAFCAPYYSPGNGYVSRSQISNLSAAMLTIKDTFVFDDEYNQNPCVDVMLHYLCNYYFPSCNLTNDRITPVCDSICFILGFTEDCPELMEYTYQELEQNDIAPPDESCNQTYRSYVNPPQMSGDCIAIEG